MTAPILPTADSLVTAAIDAIVAQRPESLAHFNAGGKWSNLTAMWRAQALVCLSRLADEVRCRRFRFATGDALRALVGSEAQTSLPTAPQSALATVVLTRTGTGPAGIIRSGTRFVKTANPDGIALPAANAYPAPIAAAAYTVTAPVAVAPTDTTVTLSLAATAPGAGANVPVFTNTGYGVPTLIQPAKPLFDPNFTVTSCTAAGGSSGVTDAVLLAAARAMQTGGFGPTDGAIVAGILSQQSARHLASFDANGYLPYGQVYVADESWSSSAVWVSQIAQNFINGWLGEGCRVRFGTVSNLHISIKPTFVLASTDALNYTADIDANVRAAAESYFNDRADWYTWRVDALRAVLSSADPRILKCSDVSVVDAATGAELSEPDNSFADLNVYQTSFSPSVTHYYLLDQGVDIQAYLPPS